MPTVRAGHMPQFNTSDYTAVRGTKAGGMEWDLSTGWHLERERGWKRHANYKKRKLMGTNGQLYTVYEYGTRDKTTGFKPGYSDYLGFHPEGDDERMAYAEHAFEDEKNCVEFKGQGHIKFMAYAMQEQILKVYFESGSVCLFFRVPDVIAGTFQYLAVSGQTEGVHRTGPKKGQPRHSLGVRFWDYIRIRGSQHGARYPFEYEKKAIGKVTRTYGGRRMVTLDRNMAHVLYGDNLNGLKNDEKISVVLNEQEYAKYAEELDRQSSERAGAIENIAGKQVLLGEDEMTGELKFDIMDLRASSNPESVLDKAEAKQEAAGGSEFQRMYDVWKDMAGERLENFIRTDTRAKAFAAKKVAEGMDVDEATALSVMSYAPEEIRKVFNARTGGLINATDARIAAFARAATGNKGEYRAWLQDTFPATGLRRYTGRTWTPQDLERMANPTIEGGISLAHAPTYKRLIQAKNWLGALNFLKTHSSELKYTVVDDKTGKNETKSLGMQRYASQYDTLQMED